MKKLLSLLLLTVFTLSLFSSCAKNLPDVETEEDLNFLGSKVVVAVGTGMWNYPPKMGGSASSDREVQRYADTEKHFNLKFDYINNINPATQFLAAALSGSMQADLLYCTNSSVYDAYLINTLIPIENIVNDAESDKWKSPASNALALFGGKAYSFFPNYWEGTPCVFCMINLNLNRLEEYDIIFPHDLIEAGEWNWENFREFLKDITFIDGDKEWFGMGMGINGVGVACIFPFVLSNGGHFLTEKDGRYSLGIESPEAMEAYEFIADLGTHGLITEVHNSDPAYSNGLKWMALAGNPATSEDFDIAQVRYPYGPKGNKDTVTAVSYGFPMWAFPIFTAYTEDEIGAVAEYLFDPLDASVYPNGWKDIVEDTVFYYESEYEYYVKAAEQSEHIDMDILSESFWNLSNAMVDLAHGIISPANAVDGIVESITEEINEKYNN